MPGYLANLSFGTCLMSLPVSLVLMLFPGTVICARNTDDKNRCRPFLESSSKAWTARRGEAKPRKRYAVVSCFGKTSSGELDDRRIAPFLGCEPFRAYGYGSRSWGAVGTAVGDDLK